MNRLIRSPSVLVIIELLSSNDILSKFRADMKPAINHVHMLLSNFPPIPRLSSAYKISTQI